MVLPVIWGGAPGATKHALSELQPLTLSAIRFLIAGIILNGWVLSKKYLDWNDIQKNWIILTSLGIFGGFAYNYLFTMGLQFTTSANGALIIAISPVMTALASVLLLEEKWSYQLGFGILISFFGVLIVISQGELENIVNLSLNIGDLMMVGCIICFTVYNLLLKVVMRDMKPIIVTAISTLFGSILLAISSLSENAWEKNINLSMQVTVEILYLAIIVTVVGSIIYNIGIHQVGASKASAFTNLVPVFALFISWFVYGEHITVIHILGSVLVVFGVIFTTFAPNV